MNQPNQQELKGYLNQVLLQLYHDLPGNENMKKAIIAKTLDEVRLFFNIDSADSDLSDFEAFWRQRLDDPDLSDYAGGYLFNLEELRRGMQHMKDIQQSYTSDQ